MQIDADARLAAAAFEHLTRDHPHLNVTAAWFADRIEIALSHQGESSPAVGLDKIAGFAAQIRGGGAGIFVGVDRVQYESRDGEAVTRLTKYIREISPRV
jgi:hypothetical protein